MAHTFPILQVWPTSGLSFPWAEHHPGASVGSFDAQLGPEGTTFALLMLINWTDLGKAIQEILGYSYRDTTGTTPRLKRILPWQHPLANQLWVKDISSVKGVILRDNQLVVNPGGGGAGAGFTANTGPWSNFELAQLTIHFWRPPYYVRSDADIGVDGEGTPREWLRYVDKNWEIQTSILSREATTFSWYGGATAGLPATAQQFQNVVGQKITKLKVKRRWYQIPEKCIFQTLVDATPNGLPKNLLYTQTTTTNPITNYVYRKGSPIGGCVNAPTGGVAFVDTTVNISNASPSITGITSTAVLAPGDFIDGPGIPLGATIVSVDSGTSITISENAFATSTTNNQIVVEKPEERFFGCPLGTLLLEGIELVPRPLQMPAFLMQIPFFGGNEPVAQTQYDVVFHFEYFDPPRGPSTHPFHGHNLMPWSGDGNWYPVQAQTNVGGTSTKMTPFNYADFTDLFKVL
jgi:hypothetical protein